MSQKLPEIGSVEVLGGEGSDELWIAVEYRTTIPVFQKFREWGPGCRETIVQRGMVVEVREYDEDPAISAIRAIKDYLECYHGDLDLEEIDPELFEMVQSG